MHFLTDLTAFSSLIFIHCYLSNTVLRFRKLHDLNMNSVENSMYFAAQSNLEVQNIVSKNAVMIDCFLLIFEKYQLLAFSEQKCIFLPGQKRHIANIPFCKQHL